MSEPIVFLNDRFVPASQAPVPGLYPVEIKQATPHLLFGEVVGAEAPAPIPLPVA